jgi:hypothetical protein
MKIFFHEENNSNKGAFLHRLSSSFLNFPTIIMGPNPSFLETVLCVHVDFENESDNLQAGVSRGSQTQIGIPQTHHWKRRTCQHVQHIIAARYMSWQLLCVRPLHAAYHGSC